MNYDHYGFKETESTIPFDSCLGRKSMMEFSIMTEAIMKKWPMPFTEKEYQRFCGICEVPVSNMIGFSIFEKFCLLMANKDAMQKLKQKSFKDYKCLKLTCLMIRIREHYPNELKSDWVNVTVRSEINGKLYALSDYFTWLYRDYKIDPVDDMTGRSVISIVSHDPFLLETTLSDIANIFKRVIEWKGENLKDLTDLIALLRYEFSHAMPFERGSASVGEWLERALYLFHGMVLTYPKVEIIDPETETSKMKQTKMIDLEALTLSLKEFIENYDTMIELHKITEATPITNLFEKNEKEEIQLDSGINLLV